MIQFLKVFLPLYLICLLLILIPIIGVYAQTPITSGPGASSITLTNPIKSDTLAGLLSDILSIIIQIGIPIIVIMVIFTGFTFVMARGNPSELGKARTALLGVLVGSAIVIGAYAISSAIKNTVCQLQSGSGAGSSSQCP
jgi:hypothetical protein